MHICEVSCPEELRCSQVITCAASDSQDIVLKKSLFQYITTYANANPDLMLLTINMLLKDCGEQDPTIRGLALRSLCSLTISNLTEYLVRLTDNELNDIHIHQNVAYATVNN